MHFQIMLLRFKSVFKRSLKILSLALHCNIKCSQTLVFKVYFLAMDHNNVVKHPTHIQKFRFRVLWSGKKTISLSQLLWPKFLDY
jgi:hypothetical protein